MVTLVRDVMVKDVITIGRDETVREACETLTDNHIGCLVVTKNGKLCGILSERDIIRSIADGGEDVAGKRVSDVMTGYVITISSAATIEKAIDVMLKNKIKKLPVMSGERIAGIITITDIIAMKSGLMDTFKCMTAAKEKSF